MNAVQRTLPAMRRHSPMAPFGGLDDEVAVYVTGLDVESNVVGWLGGWYGYRNRTPRHGRRDQ